MLVASCHNARVQEQLFCHMGRPDRAKVSLNRADTFLGDIFSDIYEFHMIGSSYTVLGRYVLLPQETHPTNLAF